MINLKTSLLLGLSLLIGKSLKAQIFTEICPSQAGNGTIVDFAYHKGQLYSTGFFTNICGEAIAHLAIWNGSGWEAAAQELPHSGHSLQVIDEELYIARYEMQADSNWLYKLGDGALEEVGAGFYLQSGSAFPNIYEVISYNGSLVVSGEFNRAGATEASGIATLIDGSWQALGSGLTGNIPGAPDLLYPHSMIRFEEQLIVAGNFGQAGGIQVNGVARWDGNEWSAMGEGFNNTVYGLGLYKGEIYAGGAFTASGMTSLNALAKWDGSNWISPGFGFQNSQAGDNTFVHTISEIGDSLYIAGGLKQVIYDDGSTEACGGIISFDGTSVHTYNGGIDNHDIEAIAILDDQLIVGGGVWESSYTGVLAIEPAIALSSTQIESAISLFPNPLSDRLLIDYRGASLHTIDIFDMKGQLVYGTDLSGLANAEIDLSDLQAGLYLASITSDLGNWQERIVKSGR